MEIEENIKQEEKRLKLLENQNKERRKASEIEEKKYKLDSKAFNEFRKFYKEQIEQNKKQETAIGKLSSSMREFTSNVQRAAEVWVSFRMFSELFGAAKELVKLNSELHRAAVNAGKTAEEIKNIKKVSADLSIQFGATAADADKVTKALVKGQYAGKLEDAAAASYQFARAMNLDAGAVAENTVELQKWGQLSAKTATAMYADIMKVAQGHGLTEEAAKSVMKATTEISGSMRAFGKNDAQIRKMNSSMAKMASSMEKVGISAGKATKLVEELLDPEKITDNIKQYAALGISITDALSGNIDPTQIEAGMKEVGQKIKDMGPIAGAAYAKAMGVSYKDAIKAADLEQITEDVMTPEETAAESMKQMTDATKDMSEKIKDFGNKLEGTLRKMGPAVMVALGIAGPILLNGLKTIISTAVTKGLKKGVEEGQGELDKLKPPSLEDDKSVMIGKKAKELAMKKNLLSKQGCELVLEETKNKLAGLNQEKGLLNERTLKIRESYKKEQKELNKILLKKAKGKSISVEEGAKIKELTNSLKSQEEEYVKILKRQTQIKEEIEDQKKLQEKASKISETAQIDYFKKGQDLAEAVGDSIKSGLSKTAIKIKEFGKSLGEKAGKVIGDIAGTGFGKVVGSAGKATAGFFKKGAGFISKAGKGLSQGLKIGAGFITKAGSGLLGVFKKGAGLLNNKKGGESGKGNGTNGIMGALGKLGALMGVIGIVITILKKNEKIGEIIQTLIDTVGGTLAKSLDGLTPIIEVLSDVINEIVGVLAEVISVLIKALMPVFKIIIGVLKIPLKIISKVLTLLLPVINLLGTILEKVFKAISAVVKVLTGGFVDLEKDTEAKERNTEATKENTNATNKPAQIKRTDNGGMSSTIAKSEKKEETKKEGANAQNSVSETKTSNNSNNDLIKQSLDKLTSKFDSFINKMDNYMFMSVVSKKEEKQTDSQQKAIITQGVAEGIQKAGELPVKISSDINMKNSIKFSLFSN